MASCSRYSLILRLNCQYKAACLWVMNPRLGGLHEHKRTRFLAIPHSRSMYDLPRQTITPSRTCAPATYHPAYAYPTRPVSFCPMSAPGSRREPVSSPTSNRRLSELPAQLELGFPFGSLLEGDNFSLAKGHYSSSPDRDSSEAFPILSRLSHQYGTSSGSGPSERAILSIENSSLTSSACTAPTSPVDSDRASSIYECAALDFPEPPPIGSPVIRRMRSSPWFLSADEVDGIAVPGRGGLAALDRLKKSHISSCLETESAKLTHNSFGYPKENLLGFCDGDLAGRIDSRRDEGAFRLSHRRNSAFLDGQVKSTQSEIYLRQHDFQSGERDNPKAVPRSESSSTPFGRLPRVIRKVASMRSDSHRTQESAFGPNAPTVTFQRPVPRVRFFRSILPGSEDHDELPRTNSKQYSRQLNKRNVFWTGQVVQTSKAKKEKQRRQSTNHMVYENDLPGTSSTALGPSFRHGTSWKEDLNKSFIDISPDRKARPKGGKERIKSLLSKANGLFSWGRSQRKADLPQGATLLILEAK